MRTFEPLIDLQDELCSQLQHSIQLGIVNGIMNMCDNGFNYRIQKTKQTMNSVKVSKHIFSDFYKLCMEVKETLEFEDDIDFYIIQDTDLNAFAYASPSPKEMPHIINIHSGLFNLLNDEELKSVIGHEIGHLADGDAAVRNGFNFVYPEGADIPLFLKKRLALYELLAELSADRYGYLACKNLEACISAEYKLASGVDIKKYNLKLKDMLAENDEQLKFLQKEGVATHNTHPFRPLRVKALELFANAETDEELEKGMSQIIELLTEFGRSEEDKYMMDFMVTSGMSLAMADKTVTREEHDLIMEKLGELTMMPEAYFDKIKKGDVNKIYTKAVKKLLEMGKEEEMLHYLIDIAMVDGRIEESEVFAIFDFGKEFGCPVQMVANLIAQKIREDYRPLAINLHNIEPENLKSHEDGTVEEDVAESQEQPEENDSEESRFALCVVEKFTERSKHLVLCGYVHHGTISVGDSVVITNGERQIEDVVIAVAVGNKLVDSNEGVDQECEIGLMLNTTGSRSINGKIDSWIVIKP